MHSIKYCNAKFARRLYEEAHEYRSPSFVALNENSYCQTTRKEASEKKAFLWVAARARSAANHYVTVSDDGRWKTSRSYDVICTAVM